MKKILALFLALLTLTALVSCKKDNAPEETAPITVWTLNGTTGFGMAKLMDDGAKGATALSYVFKVQTDATYVRDAMIYGKGENGEAAPDIAAVPTNVAAMLCEATNGGVKILAVNTAGVLWLVTANGTHPQTIAELAGKTVYCPAQNPAFIAKALFEKQDVTESVALDTTAYAAPEDLRAAVVGGLVEYAILPEPMVTVAAKANANVVAAIDLTSAWDTVFPAGSLVQGCVIARTDFIESHPDETEKFLAEYKASVEFVKAHPDAAAPMIVSAGIFANAAVAEAALPRCNLCFLTGAEMKAAMEAYLAAMPLAAIGGKMPSDAFYYGV